MRVRGGALTLSVSVAVLGMAWLIGTGTSFRSSSAITLVVIAQGWSGGYFWRLVAGKHASVAEVLGMGLAVGTAAATLSGLVVQLLGLGTGGWVLPTAATAILWLVQRLSNRRIAPLGHIDAPAWVALVIGALTSFVALWLNVVRYPLSWIGTWSRYHPDMLFFEALSTSLARLGPLDSIFLSGGTIRYHWLAYAWSGQLSLVSDAEPFVVLTRALPFVVSAMAVLLAVAWARKLTKVGWAPTLAVLLVITGGYVGATYGTILNFDSPSQAFTSAWLIALVIAYLRLIHAKIPSPRFWGLLSGLLVLSFTIAGSKVSTAAIAVAATSFVAALALLHRSEWWRQALTGAAVIGLGSIAGFGLIVSGSADPGGLRVGQLIERASSVQGLNPIPGSLGILTGTLILVVGIGLRWFGVLWLIGSRRSRWRPSSLLGLGLMLAGVGSVLLISGGLNDTWFALAASAPLSILSAVGVGRAASTIGIANTRIRPSWVLVLALVVAIVIAGIVTALWLTGGSGGNVWKSTERWMGPIAALLLVMLASALLARLPQVSGRPFIRFTALVIMIAVFAALPFRLLGFSANAFGVQSDTGLSADAFVSAEPFVDALDNQVIMEWDDDWNEAGAFLRANVSDGELVATNVMFSPIVPALSGAATYVSGILYQAPYGYTNQLETLLSRENEIFTFVRNPTSGSARELCAQGVTWLWLDSSRPISDELDKHARVAFVNEAAVVQRLHIC